MFKLSKALKAKLPENQKKTIEQDLINKSSGQCGLCGGDFNVVSDDLVADHIIPESLKGPTELKNLQVAHRECNSFKKDAQDSDVKDFLHFQRFMLDQGKRVKYDGAIEYWDVKPSLTHYELEDNLVKFQ